MTITDKEKELRHRASKIFTNPKDAQVAFKELKLYNKLKKIMEEI